MFYQCITPYNPFQRAVTLLIMPVIGWTLSVFVVDLNSVDHIRIIMYNVYVRCKLPIYRTDRPGKKKQLQHPAVGEPAILLRTGSCSSVWAHTPLIYPTC